jgi:hypothetical protein
MESAKQQIQNFQADMGGTEIYNPLNYIFHSGKYDKRIFLLTDGQVSNS